MITANARYDDMEIYNPYRVVIIVMVENRRAGIPAGPIREAVWLFFVSNFEMWR
jgi:hypothetical protein